MARYVLQPTTSAANSEPFRVNEPSWRPAHVTAPGLGASETVTMQKQALSGAWVNYFLEGELQQITTMHSGIMVNGPGVYRGVKSATAAQVGIEISTDINP